MKLGEFLAAAFVGAVAAHLWHYKDWKKNPTKGSSLQSKSMETTDQLLQKGKTYGEAFLKDYDIVLPVDQISAKVAAKADQLTEGRYEIDVTKIKKSLYL